MSKSTSKDIQTHKAPTRQVRYETVFTTTMTDAELEEFQGELCSEICVHIESGRGEEHIVTTFQTMDQVSDAESQRLQKAYAEAVGSGGLELAAGAALPS